MIRLMDIKKEYSGRCVLDIDKIIFEKGKRYALLGTNGSGKSTLLKILAGIIKPSTGSVISAVSGTKAIGYLPQKPYGFSFSVLRNVMMAIDDCPDRKEIAVKAINTVGMGAFIKADASKLSGGETQRVAFARIISVSRDLLILDEPTAAADLPGIDLLEAALLDYCKANECAVIFATHSPAQAMRLADEVIFLHHGVLTEQGETKKVLNEPESEEARAFLDHWKI